ncbi:retrovirus-related pol polyprotein from transposon TNT 1-94 [Tanacetum coccineum]
MWYNRLSEYLLKEGYKNDSICPCIFIKRFRSEYVIIAVYVDDMNIIGTHGELPKAIECLKGEFEMKDLGKTKFCLGLQIEHLKDGILVHQEAYIEKLYSSCPTRRHWNGVKHILRYLQGTKDMGLYFTNLSNTSLVGFADARYMSDPHNGISQTEYVFTSIGTAISWRSVKQTITTTSSNHAEILAIHEASRECVWLRNATQHIRRSCGISLENEAPTVLYEDNAACLTQLKECYIKGDKTKRILPKFFFTHDIQKNGDIIVQQVRSSDNLVDLFTKALPTSTFRKLSHDIGIRQLKDLK